jgi:uncharacterized protein YceK
MGIARKGEYGLPEKIPQGGPCSLTKRLLPLALALALFSGSGCISSHLVSTKAAAHWEYDPEKRMDQRVAGQPAYYGLLPFTVAMDVATFPFQLFYFAESGGGSASIKGVPAPLP